MRLVVKQLVLRTLPPKQNLPNPPGVVAGVLRKLKPFRPRMQASKTMVSVEALVGALGGKRAGSGWIARCPAHDDRNPSLSLSDGDNGPLWFCHAGCSQDAVTASLREKGLLPSPRHNLDNTPSRSGFADPEELAAWLARKAGSTVSRIDLYSPTFAEIRLDAPIGKTYRPIHRSPNGTWKTGDPPGKLPLYQIDKLPADAKIQILIVEGPKCVEAARKLGFHVTTSSHGARSARKADWTPIKDRRDILIWPDNDAPGQKYAENVRDILISVGVPREGIRILDPERFALGEGEDIAEWVERHPGETPDLAESSGRDDEPEQSNPDWISQLDRTPTGRLIPNSRSLGLVLRNDPAGQTFRYNEFSRLVCLGDRVVEESDLFRLAERIETLYGRGCTVPVARIREAVEAIARERPFHPVRDWLSGLRWDGTVRIGTLLPVYYGGRDDEYTRTVGKNLLVGAVARIYDPGAKLDTMVVLEGDQGSRKSSSLQTLFGADWVAEMKATPDSRDFEASLLGLWCIEFADLEGMGRADRNRIKMQISTRSDWVRLVYRRDPARYPRQSIFVSTANDNDYLKDPTGARRFWPVRCGKIDLEALARDRDQLWAEAVHRYRAGETWWEVPEQAKDEQEARYQSDSWEEIIAPWLSGRSEVTTTEILRDCLEILETRDHSHAAQVRVGNTLKRCGWERVKVRRGSCLAWVYRPPENVPNPELGTHGNKLGTSCTDAIVPNVPIENAFSISPRFSKLFSNKSSEIDNKLGTDGNKSIPEPCSQPCSRLVPKSTPPEMGTTWKEIE
ncbi:VapE domain-containing protein [Leptospirillum ferriphilum]